eukprot:Hpha_TRINITY_DN14260_c0_g2::TRINITY_DN14260_c0_g2_i2::g.22477::m.22477
MGMLLLCALGVANAAQEYTVWPGDGCCVDGSNNDYYWCEYPPGKINECWLACDNHAGCIAFSFIENSMCRIHCSFGAPRADCTTAGGINEGTTGRGTGAPSGTSTPSFVCASAKCYVAGLRTYDTSTSNGCCKDASDNKYQHCAYGAVSSIIECHNHCGMLTTCRGVEYQSGVECNAIIDMDSIKPAICPITGAGPVLLSANTRSTLTGTGPVVGQTGSFITPCSQRTCSSVSSPSANGPPTAGPSFTPTRPPVKTSSLVQPSSSPILSVRLRPTQSPALPSTSPPSGPPSSSPILPTLHPSMPPIGPSSSPILPTLHPSMP